MNNKQLATLLCLAVAGQANATSFDATQKSVESAFESTEKTLQDAIDAHQKPAQAILDLRKKDHEFFAEREAAIARKEQEIKNSYAQITAKLNADLAQHIAVLAQEKVTLSTCKTTLANKNNQLDQATQDSKNALEKAKANIEKLKVDYATALVTLTTKDYESKSGQQLDAIQQEQTIKASAILAKRRKEALTIVAALRDDNKLGGWEMWRAKKLAANVEAKAPAQEPTEGESKPATAQQAPKAESKLAADDSDESTN